MSPVLFSWLGTAAVAPFVTILSAWTLIVFNSYQKRWRAVDVFLFSVTAYEMAYSLFGFLLAVVSIVRPSISVPCDAVVLGLTAGRTFHLTAVTSWLLDRAVTSRQPQCVHRTRGSQVRYNMVVLATIAVFVGLTAIFARSSVSSSTICTIHPLSWDFKFSAFLASVYAMLILTGLVCCAVWFFSPPSLQYTRSMTPPASWKSSGISSCSSNSSEFLKQENLLENAQCDWRTVVLVCWIPYCLNHGPFVVMNFMGIVHPDFWTSWVDNATVWLGLAQGLLVPLTLMTVDDTFRRAMKAILRKPGKFYSDLAAGGVFQSQFQDPMKQRISPSVMMYPSQRFLRPQHQTSVIHMPHKLRWTPTSLPSLQSFGHPSGSDKKCQSPVSYGSTDEDLSKGSSSSPVDFLTPSTAYDTYSTLGSSCYTLLSFKSRSLDQNTSPASSSPDQTSNKSDDETDDAASITTNALDDFEFMGGKVSETTPTHIRTVYGGLIKSKKTEGPAAKSRSNQQPKKPMRTKKGCGQSRKASEKADRASKKLQKAEYNSQNSGKVDTNNLNNNDYKVIHGRSNRKCMDGCIQHNVPRSPTSLSLVDVISCSTSAATSLDAPISQMSMDSLEEQPSSPIANHYVTASSNPLARPIHNGEAKPSLVEDAIGCRFVQRLWRADILYSEYL